MVILGLEKPVEYGSRQIFDPTMAQMVLRAQNNYVNAMREDYLQGREDLKEFNKNFGDFFSPIQKDMEWYDQNVTGATRDLINNLYAQGIDPLRSAEGRAAISRWVNSMPVGKINQLKQSAADANEYLKNKAVLQSKGLWNPEFERMILNGRSLEDWDTARDGMWTRTAPAEYQDLNRFTTHIFDALKDSYIGTDKDHYDWYGITPEQMMQSLTPDTIGGLLNSDLGRFHYNNAKNDLLRQGIANPTDSQIMQQFKNNIVAANNEKTHRDRRINELWKMQQEDASRMRAARASRASNQPQNTPQWSFMEVLRRNTAANAAGKPIQDWGTDGKAILSTQRDAQIAFGKQVSKNTNGKSGSYSGINQFVDRYERVKYDPSALVSFLVGSNYKYVDGKPVPRWNMVDNNTIRIYPSDAGRIYSKGDVTSNTTGFRGARHSTNRKLFENADYIDVTFNGGVYGAYMKNATNENYFRIQKITVGKQNGVEDSGNGLVPKYKKTVVRNGNDFYFDSHIKSIQDDPRAGYLGTVDKKTGKVNDTKGITVTNTQDQRLMDAVQGDVYMSEIDTNGTGYDYSVTLPELLGFGQPQRQTTSK